MPVSVVHQRIDRHAAFGGFAATWPARRSSTPGRFRCRCMRNCRRTTSTGFALRFAAAGRALQCFPRNRSYRWLPASFRTLSAIGDPAGLVPDELVESEVGGWAQSFEECLDAAREHIPTVRLCDVFSPEIEHLPIRLEKFLGRWGNLAIEEVAKLAVVSLGFCSPARAGNRHVQRHVDVAGRLNAGPAATVYTLDLPGCGETSATCRAWA